MGERGRDVPVTGRLMLLVWPAALAFGGVCGAWYMPTVATEWWQRGIQLGLGTMLMGALLAFAGTVLVGRNAILWGVTAPLATYALGTLVAISLGLAGSMTLIWAAPLLVGLCVAGGLGMAYVAQRTVEDGKQAVR